MHYTYLPDDARPIYGFPGYWITPGIAGVEQPRIFSRRRNEAPCYYELRNRFTQCVGKYPRTMLVRNRKRANITIHRLVALAFIGPRPKGLEVCHIETNPALLRDPSYFARDGSPRLRYDTHDANVLDKRSVIGHSRYGEEVREAARAMRAQIPAPSCRAISVALGPAEGTIYKWVTGYRYVPSEEVKAKIKANHAIDAKFRGAPTRLTKPA